jgi:GNAT superfamily N-acetyltransferase
MIDIIEAYDPAAIDAARRLFTDYQQSLGIDLCFQDFTTELATLPGDYAPPRGRLLLAWDEDEAMGCIALRPLSEDTCEMKRLYVVPVYRAAGVGRQLVEHLIAEARSIGYRHMYLDTLPVMADAQRLYERLGFRDIPPYRHNPIEGARYMGLDLSKRSVD